MTYRRTGAVRAGVTIVEMLIVVAVVVIVIAILLPAMTTRGCGNRQLKDSSQVRGVEQGLILWSQSHQDRYPLPSAVDASNATVAEVGAAKDTTANICSLLVFNSFIVADLVYSPGEANPNINRNEDYEYEKPAAAVDPDNALWDPSFRADFTGKEPGNVSYGHTLPRGGEGALDPKVERWGATYNAMQAAIGNRGPEITGVARGRDGAAAKLTYGLGGYGKRGSSLTFLIHGSRVKWEGNIGYNDNHVNFETSEAPEALTYTLPDGKVQRDVLFYDEPEVAGANNFLGIFTRAGAEREDFVTIWD